MHRYLVCPALALASIAPLRSEVPQPIPHLETAGGATRLIVDGKPFLIRGGETGNSSATNPDYLAPFWPRFRELHLNTLLAPVTWDLIEPEQGRFDFGTVDALVRQARSADMRLVLLWFGSWKNSMSCYAPAWVKRDPDRFPRALDLDGRRQEILSPFYPANLAIDEKAFGALMKHLREVDGAAHTVILVQVENEIGMIPCARDHSAGADRAFAGAVPARLMDALQAHREVLDPQLRAVWAAAGSKGAGTWAEVFGDGPAAEEIFMAWHFARYVEGVATAGKREYPLPMYVNAALIRPGYEPGQYPSAGPLPHLFEVWREGAPSIDLISPDIYFQDFAGWARRYHVPGNALFIPESRGGPDASVNGLYAFGALDALGFSTFGIESLDEPAAGNLSASYELVDELQSRILAHQGDGTMAGFLPQGPEQRQPKQTRLGRYVLHVSFDPGVPSGGLAIASGPDEFLVAGTGLTVTFEAASGGGSVGILRDEDGRFVDGAWQNRLWLGGDQTNQGRQIRLEPGRFSLQRVELYRY